MRQKRCKQCKEAYIPSRRLQVACSPTCAYQYARDKQKAEYSKLQKAQHIRRKEALKGKSDFAREAQVEFNKYIRERDWDRPCVSCGTMTGQMHAGHYRTTKAASQLRYNTLQVWKQCATCNNHHSGAIIPYRQELVRRIGEDRVQQIENNHELADYTITYLKRLKLVFRKRGNQYRKRRQNKLNECG